MLLQCALLTLNQQSYRREKHHLSKKMTVILPNAAPEEAVKFVKGFYCLILFVPTGFW